MYANSSVGITFKIIGRVFESQSEKCHSSRHYHNVQIGFNSGMWCALLLPIFFSACI